MIKNINQQNFLTTPVVAVKSWELYNVLNDDLILLDPYVDGVLQPDTFLAQEYVDYSSNPVLDRDCNVALDQQEGDLALYEEGIFGKGTFYPDNEARNDSGTYKRLLHDQINKAFYNQYRNPLKIFGMENIDFQLSETNRYLSDKFLMFSIPQNMFGDRLTEGTIQMYDTSLDDNVNIHDDGKGNLHAGYNLFSKFQEVRQFINELIDGSYNYTCSFTNVNEQPGTMSFASASYSVSENVGFAVVHLIRTSGSDGSSDIQYFTLDGTAKSGSHYSYTVGVSGWADGDSATKTFGIPITYIPGWSWPNKAFTASLSNPYNSVLGTLSQSIITIVNEDPFVPGYVTFEFAEESVVEDMGSITLNVFRISGSDGTASLSYYTSNGTALAGTNYTAVTGALSWADGNTDVKTITIPILNDVAGTGILSFTASLTNLNGVLNGAYTRSIVNIEQIAPPVPGNVRFTSPTYSIVETAANATIYIERINGSDGITTVDFSTQDGTAVSGLNYTGEDGTLTWANGESGIKSFNVPIYNDGVYTPDLTFTASLVGITNSTYAEPSQSIVTIVNSTVYDAGIVGFPNTDESGYSTYADEDDGVATIYVERVGGYNGITTVNYTSSNGTAINPTNYTGSSGSLTWADGELGMKSYQVQINAIAGGQPTLDFTKSLYGLTNSSPAVTQSLVRIFNTGSYSPGEINIEFEEYEGNYEDDPPFDINFIRTGGTDGIVTVYFSSSNGSAIEGVNFDGTNGVETQQWVDGDAINKAFTIYPLNDGQWNSNPFPAFTMSIITVDNGTIGTISHSIVFIGNVNPKMAGSMSMVSSSYSVNENAGTATLYVQRVSGSDGTASVLIETTNGTAIAGTHYTAANDTLTWAHGDSANKTLSVPIINNADWSSTNKIFSASLDNPTGATIGTPFKSLITIVNDDAFVPTRISFTNESLYVDEPQPPIP